MNWTDDRVEVLKKLWSDGLSASQIAAELGGITRNSVIGKVHRLGLSGRDKTTSSALRTRLGRSLAQTRFNPSFSFKSRTRKHPAQPVEAAMKPDLSHTMSIFDHREGQCRWIVAEAVPNIYALRYCGAPVAYPSTSAQVEASYCLCHLRMAISSYRPRKEAA